MLSNCGAGDLESFLDSKEIKPVNLKENQPWIFIGRSDADAEVSILGNCYVSLNLYVIWWLFSHSIMFDSLWPHGLQHTRCPCPSPTPRVCPNSYPLSQWCHPTVSSSVVSFSPCPQSFPASGSFQLSQLFASGGQSIGVSASTSVLPMNTQDWSPLGWTGWISLQSKGLSRVFFSTTVQKHYFFSAQSSLWSSSHIYTWLLKNP